MYTYQVDEDEINKKLKENNIDSLGSLKGAFDEIDKEDGFDFGEVGGYEREEKNFDRVNVPDEVSEDDIKKEAETELGYNTELNKINNKYNTAEDKLNSKLNSTNENFESGLKKLASNYNNASKQSLYNSVKNGVARSSIEEGKQNQIKNNYEEGVNELTESTNGAISEIKTELDKLNTQKEEAINNFDIAYAAKLNKKIEELTKKYTKAREDAIKYNEKQSEAEQKFNAEQDEKSKAYDKEVEKKLAEHEEKLNLYGASNVYSKENLDEKQKLSLEFLNSLTKEEALNLCLTDFFVKSLGAKRTLELYRAMKERAD